MNKEEGMTYWGFRFNFREGKWGKWGKMGPLLLGLPAEAAALAFLIVPGLIVGHDYVFTLLGWEVTTAHILRAFGVLMETVFTFGHWRNFNGKQA